MSINVKLSDPDAKLVSNILGKVASMQKAKLAGVSTENFVRSLEIDITASSVGHRIEQIHGLLETSLRASS